MSKAKTIANKNLQRLRRKRRIRASINGTELRPRVSVFKSNKYFYAQAIDDVNAHTLASVDGRKLKLNANKESATKLGAEMAKSLSAKNISEVVFDRNGYLYHGVVAAFADALRDNGIKL
jgi:large subunit ribosomal protein L18